MSTAESSAIRECNSRDCDWKGVTDRMLGAVGPLCPECGETTEPVTATAAKHSDGPFAVSVDDIRKLRHMLGATDQYKKRDYGFRNYYATSGGAAMEAMERLVAAGLAEKGLSGERMTYYHATVKGCELIGFTKAQTKRAFED